MTESRGRTRDQMVAAARLLVRAGVLSHSGHANMSVRADDNDEERMLLTARGEIIDLSVEEIALVAFDGVVREGALTPTTREIVAMHAGVYRARGDVSALIHTHAPHVTAFALAHRPLPCAYEALLRCGVAADIPVAAWAPHGSDAAVQAIVDTVAAHPGTPAVLLANHGLLAFGADIAAVPGLVLAMEEAAEATLRAAAIGGALPFPPGALAEVRARRERFADPGAVFAAQRER